MTAPDTIDAALLTLLWERYGVSRRAAVGLNVLSEEYGKRILAVRLLNGTKAEGGLPPGTPPLPWVARVYPARRRPEAVEAHARVLRLLEAHGYPAPRAVVAVDGKPLTSLTHGETSRLVLVTTYVEGEVTGLSLSGLQAHGETLGRLHALAMLHDQAAAPQVRTASMLPRNELAAARSWLRDVRERVPQTLVARYEELDGACRQLHHFEDTPRVLLHNDCHPWNSVRTPAGDVVLIDWEGAGLGPAVIDVGFVTLSAATGGIVGPVIPPHPARLEALLGSYRQHHRLTATELDRLPAAIRFRTLVAACDNFAQAIREERPEEERPWYWQRYLMAEAIAVQARRILEGGDALC